MGEFQPHSRNTDSSVATGKKESHLFRGDSCKTRFSEGDQSELVDRDHLATLVVTTTGARNVGRGSASALRANVEFAGTPALSAAAEALFHLGGATFRNCHNELVIVGARTLASIFRKSTRDSLGKTRFSTISLPRCRRRRTSSRQHAPPGCFQGCSPRGIPAARSAFR